MLRLLCFGRLRRFGSPVINRSEVEKLWSVALHVEDFGLHAVPFLFLSIEHSAFKVLILLGVGLPDAAPAIEPFHMFEVFNLVVLMEERHTKYDEDNDKYCNHDFERK